MPATASASASEAVVTIGMTAMWAASLTWGHSTRAMTFLAGCFPQAPDMERKTSPRPPATRSVTRSGCSTTASKVEPIITAARGTGCPSWATATSSPSASGARGNMPTPATPRTTLPSCATTVPSFARTITAARRPPRPSSAPTPLPPLPMVSSGSKPIWIFSGSKRSAARWPSMPIPRQKGPTCVSR